jgi:hypothetical protein
LSSNPTDTLLHAAQLAGDLRVLARRLHVPMKQLMSWIDGDLPTPQPVLLRALDFLRATPDLRTASAR